MTNHNRPPMQAEQQSEREVLTSEVLADLLTIHARTSKGVWSQGTSSHHTVAKREGAEDYHVANFHHADDASFVDVAHKYMPLLIDALRASRAALSHPSTAQGWISVLDALPPDREMVAVGWLDVEDHDHAERYSIDYREDGVWQCYFNEHEHYLIAGVARGNSEDAPYTHWQRIGAIPTPPEQGSKG